MHGILHFLLSVILYEVNKTKTKTWLEASRQKRNILKSLWFEILFFTNGDQCTMKWLFFILKHVVSINHSNVKTSNNIFLNIHASCENMITFHALKISKSWQFFCWKGMILVCLLQNILQLLKTLHSECFINYQKSIALTKSCSNVHCKFSKRLKIHQNHEWSKVIVFETILFFSDTDAHCIYSRITVFPLHDRFLHLYRVAPTSGQWPILSPRMPSCGLHVAAELLFGADPSDINSRDGLPLFLEIISLPFLSKLLLHWFWSSTTLFVLNLKR